MRGSFAKITSPPEGVDRSNKKTREAERRKMGTGMEARKVTRWNAELAVWLLASKKDGIPRLATRTCKRSRICPPPCHELVWTRA